MEDATACAIPAWSRPEWVGVRWLVGVRVGDGGLTKRAPVAMTRKTPVTQWGKIPVAQWENEEYREVEGLTYITRRKQQLRHAEALVAHEQNLTRVDA